MTDNPFEKGYVAPEPQQAEQSAANDAGQDAPEPKPLGTPMITKPGAYPDIAAEDYHRNPNLLPGPSLSSSGAKLILAKSPLHFFHDSPLNPNRPPEKDKAHFSVGKAAHDVILLSERWEEFYYVTPEGFSRAKTKAMADEIAEADAAIAAGKTVLSHDQSFTVQAMAEALRRNELACATISNGVAEETLVWQDPKTGVWLRARPDFRPQALLEGRSTVVVPDLKFVAPTHADPDGFGKAIYNFGYHQSAAFYIDGLKAVYDRAPTHWLHVVVEKEPPHAVALYPLPGEDIERGRMLNRRAIDLFARCLERNEWPGYADQPREVGLPIWARMRIEETDPAAFAYADAA